MPFFIGAGLIFTQDDKLILIKGVQEVRNEKAGLYNLPAGTLEVGEDFIECITREAKEETGADIALECFVGIYQAVIAIGSNVVFTIFAGSAPSNTVFLSDEHDIIEALTYEEVVGLDKASRLRAPTILKAIDDYHAGQRLPLVAVQSWHITELASIPVEKDH